MAYPHEGSMTQIALAERLACITCPPPTTPVLPRSCSVSRLPGIVARIPGQRQTSIWSVGVGLELNDAYFLDAGLRVASNAAATLAFTVAEDLDLLLVARQRSSTDTSPSLTIAPSSAVVGNPFPAPVHSAGSPVRDRSTSARGRTTSAQGVASESSPTHLQSSVARTLPTIDRFSLSPPTGSMTRSARPIVAWRSPSRLSPARLQLPLELPPPATARARVPSARGSNSSGPSAHQRARLLTGSPSSRQSCAVELHRHARSPAALRQSAMQTHARSRPVRARST